jgi:hypothetical protein
VGLRSDAVVVADAELDAESIVEVGAGSQSVAVVYAGSVAEVGAEVGAESVTEISGTSVETVSPRSFETVTEKVDAESVTELCVSVAEVGAGSSAGFGIKEIARAAGAGAAAGFGTNEIAGAAGAGAAAGFGTNEIAGAAGAGSVAGFGTKEITGFTAEPGVDVGAGSVAEAELGRIAGPGSAGLGSGGLKIPGGLICLGFPGGLGGTLGGDLVDFFPTNSEVSKVFPVQRGWERGTYGFALPGSAQQRPALRSVAKGVM